MVWAAVFLLCNAVLRLAVLCSRPKRFANIRRANTAGSNQEHISIFSDCFLGCKGNIMTDLVWFCNACPSWRQFGGFQVQNTYGSGGAA